VKMSPPLSRQRDSQVETKLVDSSSKENESISEKSKSKLLLLSNSLLSSKPLENPWRAQKRREAAGAAVAVELSATVELSAGAATAVELSATAGGATLGSVVLPASGTVAAGSGISVALGSGMSVAAGSGAAAEPDATVGGGAATQAAGAVVRLSNT